MRKREQQHPTHRSIHPCRPPPTRRQVCMRDAAAYRSRCGYRRAAKCFQICSKLLGHGIALGWSKSLRCQTRHNRPATWPPSRGKYMIVSCSSSYFNSCHILPPRRQQCPGSCVARPLHGVPPISDMFWSIRSTGAHERNGGSYC